MVAEEKIRDFMEVADQLSVLLDQETALLRQHQLSDIESLQESKAALSQIYAGLSEEMYDQLRADPGQLPDSLRTELREKTEKFQASANENKSWLLAALKVNQRIVEAVAEAVLEAEADPDIYIGNGAMNNGKKNAAVHMSLNQLA